MACCVEHCTARETKAFDPKKLPKALRVAMDSSPLEGAGRVEDTINLLGHAGRKIVACAAKLLGWAEDRVCREAGCPLLLASSTKAGSLSPRCWANCEPSFQGNQTR